MIRAVLGKLLKIVGPIAKPKRGDGVSVLDFEVTDTRGERARIGDKYGGRVLLIVNVASKCGFTPQYAGLEQLYKKYRENGLTVIAFPCNDFGAQEPGTDAEVQEFCQVNYGVTFDVMKKITVSGADSPPLYQALTSSENGALGGPIKWNFTKFLVGRDGRVKSRIEPLTPPDTASVIKLIEAELEKGK